MIREHPRTPEEAAKFINPNSETYMYKIGNVAILMMNGIPLAKDSNKLLYANSEQHSFDYIDMGVSDILSPETDIVSDLLKRHSVTQNPDNFSPNIEISSQLSSISGLLYLIFKLSNKLKLDTRQRATHKLNQFLEDIRSQPEKPFLFVNGHGGYRVGANEDIWTWGETHSKVYIQAETLMSDIYDKSGKNHYSAIVLTMCNEAEISPPKYDDTNIYYVKGDSDMHSNKRKSARV